MENHQVANGANAGESNRAHDAVRVCLATRGNSTQAAFPSLRHLLTQDADVFTEVDHSLWYDLIEELRERYAAGRLRCASGKTGERSRSEGDRSNSEGDRGKSVGDAGKSVGDAGSARVHRGNLRHDRPIIRADRDSRSRPRCPFQPIAHACPLGAVRHTLDVDHAASDFVELVERRVQSLRVTRRVRRHPHHLR